MSLERSLDACGEGEVTTEVMRSSYDCRLYLSPDLRNERFHFTVLRHASMSLSPGVAWLIVNGLTV
jgi:hypothetical protein